MKRVSMKAAFFVGFIVFIISLLSNVLLPDVSNVIIPIILVLTALVGGIIGNKLFRKE